MNRPTKTYSGGKTNYIVSVDKLNEIIDHLNDLFVGKAMTNDEMRLLQHIVDDICNLANENQLLKIYNQNQILPFSSNH